MSTLQAPTLPGMDVGTPKPVSPVSRGTQDRHDATAGCGGCPTRWALGSSAAHCTECHRTWRSAGGFDTHREGPIDRRTCRGEAEIRALGFEPDERGVWRQPRPIDTLPDGA